jgi:hypothetical protein
MSTTTVELKKNTVRILEELKKKYGAKSIDETINRIIFKAENISDSRFGSHPEMKAFKQKEEAEFHY